MYKINPFNIGDAVVHPASGQRGLVVEVRGQLVKFEIIGKPKAGKEPEHATYSCKKIKLVARRAQVFAGAMALKVRAEKERTILRRFARWARTLWRAAKSPATE